MNNLVKLKSSFIAFACLCLVSALAASAIDLNEQAPSLEERRAISWLDGWLYRKALNIAGSPAGPQLNYPIRLCVHVDSGMDFGEDVYLNNKCRSDFGDIRFTDATNNSLDYWIQERMDGDQAVFWVELGLIPASPGFTTIYTYYGNPAATTTSNKNFVFPLATDFEDNTTQGWSISWTTYIEGDGISSTAYQGNYCRIAGRAYGYPSGVGRGPFSEKFQTEIYMGAGSYYIEGACRFVDRGNTGIKFVVDSAVVDEISYPGTQWNSLEGNFTVGSGFINIDVEFNVQIGDYVQYEHNSYCIDSMLVRKWCDPEPAHGAWGAEDMWSEDGVPPSLWSVEWTPTSPPPFIPAAVPRPGECVEVRANTTDVGSGIARVQLSYRLAGDWWCNVSMAWNATSGLWDAIVPGYPGNCSIEFFVTANDFMDNFNVGEIQSYSVKSLLPGDIDGDGDVDIFDLVIAAGHYGQSW